MIIRSTLFVVIAGVSACSCSNSKSASSRDMSVLDGQLYNSPDTTGIVGILPEAQSSSVALDSKVLFNISGLATLTKKEFEMGMRVSTLQGDAIDGTFSWGAATLATDSQILTFVPKQLFHADTDYIVTFTRYGAYNPEYVFDFTNRSDGTNVFRTTFTTASRLRIQWLQLLPPKGDPKSVGSVRIRFSEPLQPNSAIKVFASAFQSMGSAGEISDPAPAYLSSGMPVRELEYKLYQPVPATGNVQLNLSGLQALSGAILDYSSYVNGKEIAGPALFEFQPSQMASLPNAVLWYWRPPLPSL